MTANMWNMLGYSLLIMGVLLCFGAFALAKIAVLKRAVSSVGTLIKTSARHGQKYSSCANHRGLSIFQKFRESRGRRVIVRSKKRFLRGSFCSNSRPRSSSLRQISLRTSNSKNSGVNRVNKRLLCLV